VAPFRAATAGQVQDAPEDSAAGKLQSRFACLAGLFVVLWFSFSVQHRLPV